MSSGIQEIIGQATNKEDIFFVALIASGHVVLILGVLYCLSRYKPNPQEWGYTNPPGKLTPPPGPPEGGGLKKRVEESKIY